MATDFCSDIAVCVERGGGYVLYRLPDAEYGTCIMCFDTPRSLASLADLDDNVGWVVWPFSVEANCPPVLITPQKVSRFHCESAMEDVVSHVAIAATSVADDGRGNYEAAFQCCSGHLRSGQVAKVVLSRSKQMTLSAGFSPLAAFRAACRLYPHGYVALWNTPQTGCWLTATPEVLLVSDDKGNYATMALAGTLPEGDKPYHWNDKLCREQALVADYIRSRLAPLVESMQMSETYTQPAGPVVHLRTDFSFRAMPGVTLGTLVGRLHPTPAVCGCPVAEARDVIRQAERFSRRYYAGFSGPIGVLGESNLFVSLRCMELTGNIARLYAGGGLLSDSHVDEEWEETCRKMLPMEEVLSFGVLS